MNIKRLALTKRYLALRAAHPTMAANQALNHAKQPMAKPLDWNANGDRAEWREQGFDIVAEVEQDESPDTSYLGQFTLTPTSWPRGIKVDPDEAGDSRVYPSRRYGKAEVWFVPCNSYREHVKALRAHHSKSESDRLAREYVYQDMRRLRALNMNDWTFAGIVVTVYRKGIELGDASVWGMEWFSKRTPGFDPNTDSSEYFTETARELAEEALSQAQDNLESLCVRKGGR